MNSQPTRAQLESTDATSRERRRLCGEHVCCACEHTEPIIALKNR